MASKAEEALRVLIIDADNVRRGMLACTLPASRFSLEFARSAEKGIELLGRFAPEVVIVGRDRTAVELCHRIRSLPGGARCLLLVMDEQFRDEALGTAEAEAAGADGCLPFPFEVDALAHKLATAPAARRTTPPSAAAHPSTPARASAAPAPALAAQPASASGGWDEFRARVGRLRAELDALDYYQLLALPRTATGAEVKDAYFRCSIELHPDRFMQLDDQALRQDIYEVYKRLSEAFKVLINPEARARYDALLARDGSRGLRYLEITRGELADVEDPTADASTPGAKRYLHYALLAEAEGNLRSARMYLSLALQCEPSSVPLRARLDAVTRRLGT
jgi:CheY-like chemotaxis protein